MTENDRYSEIADLLSSLPRESPGEPFTIRAMAAYDQRQDRRWAPTTTARWSWSAAAVLLLVLGFVAGSRFSSEHPESNTQLTQSQSLLARHRALEEELSRIRELNAQTAPVLYLGGEENYDLVFDLSTLINRELHREAQPAAVRPASHQINP
ncbi:MAG: hypothetical protein V3S30_10100 [Thermoanaerobaculia bacterium]